MNITHCEHATLCLIHDCLPSGVAAGGRGVRGEAGAGHALFDRNVAVRAG